LFYGPLHFMVVREVVRALGAATPPPTTIVDLGCGTGVAGAAWADEAGPGAHVTGIDDSGWAVTEADWNARTLGVKATFQRSDLLKVRLGKHGEGLIAAYTMNELDDADRETMRERLLGAAKAEAASWSWSRSPDAGSVVARLAFRRPADARHLAFPGVPARMRLLDKAAGYGTSN
jgi:hypothetical protein